MIRKQTKLGVTAGVIITLLSVGDFANAQAPGAIAGSGFLTIITGGTYPFASNGYSLFIPANSGNSYQRIEIYNVSSGTGAYSYTVTGASTAIISVNDSLVGFGTNSANFSTFDSGTFYSTLNSYPTAYQMGNFDYASGNALSSMAGQTFVVSVDDGLYPFAYTGSFTFRAAASGNTYTITGDGVNTTNSSGTYSYSLVNRSTGQMQISDSVSGSSTVYFGFTDSSDGSYALTQPTSGGFQIGSFMINGGPLLAGTIRGTNIVLNWPTNTLGFTLQWSTNLASANWSNATPSPVIVGGQYAITNNLTDNFKFYRLKK